VRSVLPGLPSWFLALTDATSPPRAGPKQRRGRRRRTTRLKKQRGQAKRRLPMGTPTDPQEGAQAAPCTASPKGSAKLAPPSTHEEKKLPEPAVVKRPAGKEKPPDSELVAQPAARTETHGRGFARGGRPRRVRGTLVCRGAGSG
jgi:hypothetical protein